MTAAAQAVSAVSEFGFWVPIGIFCARVADVSMGTVRLICVTRGHRAVAVALGFVETTIWVLAVSAVFRHLDRWINVAAFAGGYATGVAVGMWIERKLALGWQVVTFMSRLAGHTVADRLRQAEWMVTTLEGNGHYGPVSVCLAVVPRKQVPLVVETARQADPQAVVTIEDVVERNGGAGPTSGLECVARNQSVRWPESSCKQTSRAGMVGLQGYSGRVFRGRRRTHNSVRDDTRASPAQRLSA